MAESLRFAVRGPWRPGARVLFRVGRRTLVESLYLLTGPVTAAAGLLLVLGGLCAGAVGLLVPGGSRLVAGALALARWSADVERWRIAKVRSLVGGAQDAGRRPRPKKTAAASDPGLWLDVAPAVAVLPVVLVTSVVTGLWWWVGVAAATFPRRHPEVSSGSLRPQTLYVGSAASHIDLSLGLTSPDGHLAFVITLCLLLLFTLPLVTRACVAAQAGLGQVLLSGMSALYRRIRGLEQERDTARAQTVAAVTAEAAVYFVVAEALTNVAKHSHARRCVVGLRHGAGTMRAWVTDDGAGGAALGKGHGLQGLDDRVRAAGGRLRVTSPYGGPTTPSTAGCSPSSPTSGPDGRPGSEGLPHPEGVDRPTPRVRHAPVTWRRRCGRWLA